ncbi:DUF943 family protein [Paramixta manurensis]|uniref:DUF943 family protein n=1 Tax=Paramixta manurensis TaxID=2740817 RepID=A0A6M8UD05_9GAMM|nr:DUF943 family protein [Erwiniaceae bacterium PD-1]
MKKYLLVAILIAATIGWWGYLKSHPTTLVATHKMGEKGFISVVLIKNPPLTDSGKITWWKDNAKYFRDKYDIPSSAINDYFYIKIWDFADGYKPLEKYDRLCFEEMKTQYNCIDKNWVMTISNTRNGELRYSMGESAWLEQKDGSLVKVK